MNIAIFYGGDHFVKPLAADWRDKGHNVRMNPNYSIWPDFKPDLIFFEFCNNNLVQFTRRFPKECRVVGRFHAVEYRMGYHRTIDWTKVDDLIFVSDLYRAGCEKEAVIDTNIHTVNNGVDLKMFTLKKSFEPTYKLAFVGHLQDSKGIADLDSWVEKFKTIDSRYTLEIAAGEIPYSEMNAWLEDKDYLIHPSRSESFCYAVAEALAKGIRPLIHNWPGSAKTFGAEFFYSNWNLKQDPVRFRKIIEDRYDQDRMIKEINDICLV